jgi:hypothetical protein
VGQLWHHVGAGDQVEGGLVERPGATVNVDLLEVRTAVDGSFEDAVAGFLGNSFG